MFLGHFKCGAVLLRRRVGVVLLGLGLMISFPNAGGLAAEHYETALALTPEMQLFEAAAKNNINGIQAAIHAGADVSATNDDGLNAAGIAIKSGNFRIAYYLLELANNSGEDYASQLLITSTDIRFVNEAPIEMASLPEVSGPLANAQLRRKPSPPKRKFISPSLSKTTHSDGWKPEIIVLAATENSSIAAGVEKQNDANNGTYRLYLSPALQPGRTFILKDAETKGCFQKGPDYSWFCVDPVGWPDGVRKRFFVRSPLYQGSQAITRFDRGKLTRVFIVFPNEHYTAIRKYLIKHWGQPSNTIDAKMALFGSPGIINRRMRWISPGRETEKTVVELRQFDDISGMLPSTYISVLEIFEKGAAPMFKYVEQSDFVYRTILLGGIVPTAQ